MTRYPIFDTYLTAREMEVVRLVAKGLSNKQMALELRVSIKTVEKFRHSANSKLRVDNGIAMVRVAIRTGLVTVEDFLGNDVGENVAHRGYDVSRHNTGAFSPPAWFGVRH